MRTFLLGHEDRAVEEVEVGIARRMCKRAIAHHRALDRHAVTNQLLAVRGIQRETQGVRIDIGIERAAVGKGARDTPQLGHLNRDFGEHERWHIEERHVGDDAVLPMSARPDATSGRVDLDVVLVRLEQPVLQPNLDHRDDAVPAHRAIAFVV